MSPVFAKYISSEGMPAAPQNSGAVVCDCERHATASAFRRSASRFASSEPSAGTVEPAIAARFPSFFLLREEQLAHEPAFISLASTGPGTRAPRVVLDFGLEVEPPRHVPRQRVPLGTEVRVLAGAAVAPAKDSPRPASAACTVLFPAALTNSGLLRYSVHYTPDGLVVE